MLAFARLWIVLALAAALFGCGSSPLGRAPSSGHAVTVPHAVASDNEDAVARSEPGGRPEPGTALPVTGAEPYRGDPLAPVTWIVWSDFQCPFCARLMPTLNELAITYGPKKLRIVWRNNPLPFHKDARPAAIAAATVFRLGGVQAFWTFHRLAFENQQQLDPESFARWAAASGVNQADFVRAFNRSQYAQDVDDDLVAAKNAGVTGTPASFINGVFVSGAQPREKFTEIIDEQLAAAQKLAQTGTPRTRIYAELSDKNYKSRPPESSSSEPEDTTSVWKVPVGGSPVRGKPTALVTMVMFSDFQCPFCSRAVQTVETLQTTYGDRLRVVFKHNPLPFHPRAEPAAELAIEARVQKGDDAFWKAYALLFKNQQSLSDQDLDQYATSLGLDVARVDRAIASHKHAAVIEADQDLADDVQAPGTPHFFINGRRLSGAQPVEKFKAIIDEEIAHAEGLVRRGIAASKLYDEMQKGAKGAPPFERIVVPAPTRANPAKGAGPGARIVIQMFADFQCPFCKKAEPTIDELMKAFPGQIRVVWRNLPLPMHAQAALAAEAALEAFEQKGDSGFWKMADLLFNDQTQSGLDRQGLESKAAQIGLDLVRFRRALDQHTHKAAVDADKALADSVSVSGTPAFAVNDYFVSGSQPLTRFKKVVQKALGPREPPAPGSIHGAIAPSAAPSTPPSAAPGQALMGAKHLLVMYQGSARAPSNVTRTKSEARARAEEALAKARRGARFEDLVATYSDEPSAAARGGDLGSFPKGAMVPEFERAVVGLKVGELSGIVETQFGFHVILRTK